MLIILAGQIGVLALRLPQPFITALELRCQILPTKGTHPRLCFEPGKLSFLCFLQSRRPYAKT